jgi:hypothetical protein
MTDFAEFLKKQQAELHAERQEKRKREDKVATDELKLNGLIRTEWPILLETLRSNTAGEKFDGHAFIWRDNGNLSLGNASMAVWHGVGFEVALTRGVGDRDAHKLRPSLNTKDELVWQCDGPIPLGSDRTTQGLAQALLAELLRYYKNA